MNCPRCHAESPDDSMFCESCGGSLAVACASCGADISPGARYCRACGRSARAAQPVPVGEGPRPLPSSFVGGRYRVRKLIGQGATKRVFLARDARLERDVAFSLLKGDGLDGEGVLRIRREAQAMARLGDHPNIVTVYDVGEDDDGQSFIVSQYMAGGSIEELLLASEQRQLPPAEAVRLGAQVCAALAYAHNLGVIHRDLKPGNVWLDGEGSVGLGDFGLAVALDRSRLTVAGMMVGTVAYMPPEQALGQRPDARSDLYALGAMLYEMVTGRPPFVGDDAVAVISQHINTPPVQPAWHNPDVPRALNALIMSLLEKDPAQRPPSASEVERALVSIEQDAADAISPPAAAVVPLAESGPLYLRTFVGREAELRQLHEAFDAALSGEGALMMVVGEPGVGKTSVCEQLATYAALRGGRTLVGHCYEEGSLSLPYLPFVEAMRTYVLAHDGDLKRELGTGAGDVARIVLEIRDRIDVEPSQAADPEEERYRLLQAVTAFLRNASAVQPLVIVLEDLHDADRGTLDLLTHLARSLAGARLLVVGTYRDVEVDRAHPLANALVELRRAAQFGRVLLRGLTADEVQRMLSAIAGHDVPWAFAEAVHRQTEGNPLFVQEVTRYLAEEGLIRREGGQWRSTTEQLALSIPEGLRDVIGKRLSRLSAECNRLLALAAVIGRDFALSTLRAVAAMTEDDLLVSLEEAVRVGVLEERSQGGDVRYRFAHAFFRQSLYEELIAPRRIRLHQQVAKALEMQYAGRLEEHATELAEHYSYSSDQADLAKSVAYGEMAARRASAVYAHGESAELYRRALEVQEVLDPDDWAKRCDLLTAAAEPRRLSGDIDGCRDNLFEAADLARARGDRDRLVQAAVGFREVLGILGVPDPELASLLREALAALGDDEPRLRIMLLGRLVGQIAFAEEGFAEAEAISERMLADARELNDAETLFFALRAKNFVAMRKPGDDTARLQVLGEMEELASVAGAIEAQVMIPMMRAFVALRAGDLAGWEEQRIAHERLAERYRLQFGLRTGKGLLATRYLLAGDLEQAERTISAVDELLLGWRELEELGMARLQTFVLRKAQDRLGEAEESLRRAVEKYPDSPVLRCHSMIFHAEQGHEPECRAELGRLAADGFARLSEDRNWDYYAACLTDACSYLGDVEHAAQIYPLLAPWAGRFVVPRIAMTVCIGPADLYLGRLCATMGRWDDAERHYRDAMSMCTAMPTPPWLAETQHAYARMLLAREQPGDREHALSLLADAGDTARRIGMRKLLEQVLALRMEAQGVAGADVMTSISAVASAAQREKTDLRPLAAPDGHITIMFSDIEGSTQLNERLGDERWMTLLRLHNAAVREQVAAHGGTVVKTAGDGFMIAFRSPQRALRCAVAMQRAMREHNARHSDHPLRIRIGLHTGEAIREADDFYGRNVTLASRVGDLAHAGEILVSAAFRELAGDADARFGEPREAELKGLAGPHMVYAVLWDEDGASP